jgi:hypothetical protein
MTYKLEVTLKQYRKLYEPISNPYQRAVLSANHDDANKLAYEINLEVNEWFKSKNVINYDFRTNKGFRKEDNREYHNEFERIFDGSNAYFFLEFETADQAMIFKLTWL